MREEKKLKIKIIANNICFVLKCWYNKKIGSMLFF